MNFYLKQLALGFDMSWINKLISLGIDNELIAKSGVNEQHCQLIYKRLNCKHTAILDIHINAVWQLQALSGDLVLYEKLDSSLCDNQGNTIGDYAAWSGNVKALEYIEKQATTLLDQANYSQSSIALFAALSGNPDVLEWLKNKRPTLLKSVTLSLMNIGNYAALSGNPAMLTWVKEFDQSLFKRIKNLFTIGHFAAISGNTEALDWVKKYDSELLTCSSNNQTTIGHLAAKSGHVEALEWVRKNYPETLTQISKPYKFTIAHYAAMSGNPLALEWVQEYYPQFLTQLSNKKFTIAHSAVRARGTETLKWIKKHYPTMLNQTSQSGENIAHHAASEGRVDILKWIRTNKPALLTQIANKGLNVAHCIVKSGNVAAFRWAKNTYYPDFLEQEDEDELTILHRAAKSGLIDALEWAKNNNSALLNTQDRDGNTIALWAAHYGQIKILDWIKANCPHLLTKTNNYKQTIAHAAALTDHKKVIEWIKNNNYTDLLTRKDSEGNTFAHYAADKKTIKILTWFKINPMPNLLVKRNKNELTFVDLALKSGGPVQFNTALALTATPTSYHLPSSIGTHAFTQIIQALNSNYFLQEVIYSDRVGPMHAKLPQEMIKQLSYNKELATNVSSFSFFLRGIFQTNSALQTLPNEILRLILYHCLPTGTSVENTDKLFAKSYHAVTPTTGSISKKLLLQFLDQENNRLTKSTFFEKLGQFFQLIESSAAKRQAIQALQAALKDEKLQNLDELKTAVITWKKTHAKTLQTQRNRFGAFFKTKQTPKTQALLTHIDNVLLFNSEQPQAQESATLQQ